MKKLVIMLAIVILAGFAWLIADRLSPDAVGMALGMLFGVLAGVPTALLMMASNRRRYEEDEEEDGRMPAKGYGQYGIGPYGQQAPVIVLTAPQYQQPPTIDAAGYPTRPALPGPSANYIPNARQFRLVGEKEELIEEW
jgi:hypothetical protein